MPEKKVIVVLGGGGFIGSHLCRRFLDEGCRVVCVDNFVTGNRENLAPLADRRGFELVEADIADGLDVAGPVDAVLHFASLASPVSYLTFPVETLKSGSIGTFHALNLAQEKHARFLMASTSEVYGDPLVNPQPESYWGNVNPIGPRACYDESKRFSEAAASVYGEALGVNVGILRIFNTFGPLMRIDDGRVIPNLISQALSGAPLTVAGNGSQTRSFCYIDDLVEGIVRATRSSVRGPINLGNPNEMSILQAAQHILNLTGSDSEINFVPLPTDDPHIRRPDISLAYKELDWTPEIEFIDGLSRMIAWVRAVTAGRGLHEASAGV
ncbi:NAD-dependent epimerase/dehydratase family protein [Streptomyces sp. NPDC001401]|uniref:NAD-dependent epimerase/dehydratase family protein n=1 Tax=Streptomyces sp. NPDC001401 TaxID=3364570 RepID=UPI0036CE33BE